MQSRQAASRRRSGDLASAKGKDSPAKTRRESSASHGSISCPICGLQLTPAELPAHYEWELNRVEDEPPDVVEEAAKTGIRARRGAAVAAAQQIASVHKGKGPAVAVNQLDDNEMLLYRVKASRLKRAALTLNKPGSVKRRRGDFDEQEPDLDSSICFMCNAPLPTEPEALNQHIDDCLATQASMAESFLDDRSAQVDHEGEQDGWEEYEWAGQTRIRASAMLEGGYAASGFAVRNKADLDTDEEIDIDDDDTEAFGHQQYGEDQLNEFRPASDERALVIEQEQVEVWESLPQQSHNIPTGTDSNTKLVIDSLKTRIRDLEASAKSTHKCLICLDPYKTPLVSVVCWHVHCEQCWLQTLGAKRLCPQCQKITAPADLRRVYL
ncbi:hypothetical protein HDU90_004382 [Geranomyces variabilis]|nr:hypothetical protein HDU90_004382 [Geranomyces variabilis]